ncbi:MAG: LLM class flavin-dependent oxidoreductase [Caulobacteraceae bacterium]|nr:LLM class flavin-dependent oxidoreductase [Caulobacteraceae bacterium]
MKFGVLANTSISDWELAVFAEKLGYDSIWFGDSQMIWSDVYATMAVAAHNTSRIRIGPGVSIAGTRIPPVAANAIATVNQLAPGRVHMSIGTGHTAMRTMGFDPLKAKAFREYVRVLRALLDGEAVAFTWEGETHEIAHMHRAEGFFDFEHKIPLYVAANGPLACKTTGAYGDGRVAGGESPAQLARSTALMREGAHAVGRDLPEPFPQTHLTTALVLRPGEKLDSERVVDAVGAEVTARMHMSWEILMQTGQEPRVPGDCRDDWEQYKSYVAGLDLPRDALRRRVHRGHCTYLVPEERRFVTPAMIRATSSLIAEPDEIIAQMRPLEAAGLTELVFLCPTGASREVYADLKKQVIDRY